MQAQLVPETTSPAADEAAFDEPWSLRPVPEAEAAPLLAAEPRLRTRSGRTGSPGLQARIILLMVGSLSLLALVSAFSSSAVLQSQMLESARSKGEVIANAVLHSAAGSPAGEQGAVGSRSVLESFKGIEDVAYVVLYDRGGRPVASTLDLLPEALVSLPAAASADGSSLLMVPRGDGGRLFTAMEITAAGPSGTARVGMDRDAIVTRLRSSSVDLMVIQAMVALVALLFAILFSARLVRPIRALVRVARAVGRGDLSHTVQTTARDEVGLLARTFNDTIRRLRGLVVTEAERDEERSQRESLQKNIRQFLRVTQKIAGGDFSQRGEVTADVLGNVVDSINVMVQEIADTLRGVREATESVSASSDEVIQTTELIGKRVETQLGAARQASEGVVELTASVRQVAETAEASSQTALKTREAAQTGQKAVRETLESMDRIRDEVKGISRRIKSLGDRSLEISEIVETISYISSQTNLLALNAAIEASGAGEQGERFGVVADEVRKLAEEAATSSRDIGRLIKSVQMEINEVVVVMEQGTDEVQTGFLLARQAGNRLEDIAQISRASADLAQRISEATTGQVETAERVANSVTTIASLATGTDEAVTVGRQTVEKVRELAAQLRTRLSTFRLPEST